MRVCEIAKEAGVTSAEVLRVAEKTGVEVSSAVSTVEDGELAALKLALANAPKADATAAATQMADAGYLTVDGIAEEDEATFVATSGLDEVTAKGVYAAAKAVAELTANANEEEEA